MSVMSPSEKDAERRRLHSQRDAREGDIRDMGEHEHRQDTSEAVAMLRARVAEFADDASLADDLCMLAARIE